VRHRRWSRRRCRATTPPRPPTRELASLRRIRLDSVARPPDRRRRTFDEPPACLPGDDLKCCRGFTTAVATATAPQRVHGWCRLPTETGQAARRCAWWCPSFLPPLCGCPACQVAPWEYGGDVRVLKTFSKRVPMGAIDHQSCLRDRRANQSCIDGTGACEK